MAIYTGTMNMAQWALISNQPLVEAVTYSLIDNGSVMARDIPWTNKSTLIANGVRFEGNLPSINWSPLNAEGVVSIGSPTPYQETAYVVRNYVDVDKQYIQDVNSIQDPRAVQVEATMRALAFDFNTQFINNDHVVGNQNAPVGLKYRISNGSMYGVRSGNFVDCGGATNDMSVAGMTAATANGFFEALDQLLWSVDAPNGNLSGINNVPGSSPGVVLYCNDVMLRRLRRALRLMGTTGGLEITHDMFNRSIESYKGCPIYDIGYQRDQATRIITTTETAAGAAGASTFTSIYAVNYGPGHFQGWQYEPCQARDLGLLNNGVIYRTLVDWAGGFLNQSNRSLARLYDIKLA